MQVPMVKTLAISSMINYLLINSIKSCLINKQRPKSLIKTLAINLCGASHFSTIFRSTEYLINKRCFVMSCRDMRTKYSVRL